MVPDNGGFPSEATHVSMFSHRLLKSDFHRFSTRTGLPPSPVRYAFQKTATLFVIAFVNNLSLIIAPACPVCQCFLAIYCAQEYNIT